MADVTEFQEREEEAPLLFKTYALYWDAIFAFRSDICLNGKLQVPEEFYIGSESDEETVSISNRELHRLQDDLHHLHDENLALTMVVANNWHDRVQPLKAPLDELHKLTIQCCFYYIASFKTKTSPTLPSSKCVILAELGRQGALVADRRDDEAIFINTYCLKK